jgi:hypothetical protein
MDKKKSSFLAFLRSKTRLNNIKKAKGKYVLNLKHADEQDAGQNSYARTTTLVNQEITL